MLIWHQLYCLLKWVFEALKACAKKNVKVVTIISSGFSEVGNLEEERKITTFAAENGIRIIGS